MIQHEAVKANGHRIAGIVTGGKQSHLQRQTGEIGDPVSRAVGGRNPRIAGQLALEEQEVRRIFAHDQKPEVGVTRGIGAIVAAGLSGLSYVVIEILAGLGADAEQVKARERNPGFAPVERVDIVRRSVCIIGAGEQTGVIVVHHAATVIKIGCV